MENGLEVSSKEKKATTANVTSKNKETFMPMFIVALLIIATL